MLAFVKELEDMQKHTKGYMFDSLVYRYKVALEEATFHRATVYMTKHNCGRAEAEAHVRTYDNERDLMRFIQILSEAIGEHD